MDKMEDKIRKLKSDVAQFNRRFGDLQAKIRELNEQVRAIMV